MFLCVFKTLSIKLNNISPAYSALFLEMSSDLPAPQHHDIKSKLFSCININNKKQKTKTSQKSDYTRSYKHILYIHSRIHLFMCHFNFHTVFSFKLMQYFILIAPNSEIMNNNSEKPVIKKRCSRYQQILQKVLPVKQRAFQHDGS